MDYIEREPSITTIDQSLPSVVTVIIPMPTNVKNRKLVLFAIGFVSLSLYMSFALMAPFFPAESSAKQVSTTVSGFIFSVYSLAMMITAPIVGKLIPVIGIKFLCMSGIWMAGCSSILFGLLDLIDDPVTFVSFCFVVRCFMAVGSGERLLNMQ